MIVCDICTGRHLTSACVIARDRVEQCVTAPVVDDFEPPLAPVIPLPMFRGEERREIRHWSPRTHRVADISGLHIRKPSGAISATRLA